MSMPKPEGITVKNDENQRRPTQPAGTTESQAPDELEPDDLDVDPDEAAKIHGGIVGPCNMPGPRLS
jgi:hypothetical protein